MDFARRNAELARPIDEGLDGQVRKDRADFRIRCIAIDRNDDDIQLERSENARDKIDGVRKLNGDEVSGVHSRATQVTSDFAGALRKGTPRYDSARVSLDQRGRVRLCCN